MRAETVEILLVRHAPADHGGRLTGRRDVPAILPDAAALAPLRAALDGCAVMSSPARRCRETAAALFPGAVETDACLWEQDFGEAEGTPFDALPDLGPMSRGDIARHAYPGGESFLDLCARVRPALEAAEGRLAVIAHAGTVRAALALALSDPADALAFDIAPLSLTRVLLLPGGVSILGVNRTFA
ncbi:histidine phosphatase family protein [Roseivivax sediminis]|uniref:Alpha-ribazole phosphatase n=1 Tax=Roseivivax sediminis TaxID=936889 RepID=A0A1I1TZA3_9RHOB|nr:histidine phosphatase family protein [Roseivivax sediminis]SFD63951.1 alpha-ribazole phosphatase [Roseivivax sediminis]